VNTDIQSLLVKAKESSSAAKLLCNQAYYAMFYVAEALLVSIGLSYSSHAAVLSAFGREFSKSKKLDPKFHRWLIDAQDSRNIADYGIEVSISEQQALEICECADTFIQAAKEYMNAQETQS